MENKWYQKTWLPFAAFAYIIICIFDFIIMPVYVTAHNSRIENAVFNTLEGKDALAFADAMIKANQASRQWNPITLLGAGMFHLSFGALLTGGAVTRGFAKKSEVEGYWRYGIDTPYTPPANDAGARSVSNSHIRRYNTPQSYQESTDSGPMKRTDNLG